jgi:hypothetical protein
MASEPSSFPLFRIIMDAKRKKPRRADDYVHGYSEREDQRLRDQSQTLADLLHHDSIYPGGSRVLEAGCGVYVDASRPAWVEGFTRNTYIAMVEGVRQRALAAGLIDRRAWAKGIADLKATASAGGTFCYTFFKAAAVKN